MAILRQGILGGFRGKIGNVVGTGWKGRAVMKSLPLTVANPRTAGQVKQRNRFSVLVVLGSILLASIIKPLWDRFASGMSGFNAFISANQNAFEANGAMNYGALQIARGRMLPPGLTAASITGNNFSVTLANPAGDRFALPTDNIFILILDSDGNKIKYAGQATQLRGSAATQTVTGTFQNIGAVSGDAHVYAAYLRNDGSEVSNSGHREV
jgi:hypothetical protein